MEHILEWLKKNKQIKKWEHEPETFWFEGIMRGCRSYLPDFRVTEHHTIAVLYGPRPLSQMDKVDRIRACYQHACLCYVSGKSMTNASLRERFKTDSLAIVSKIISDAAKAGLIQSTEVSSRKYAKYMPFWAMHQKKLI